MRALGAQYVRYDTAPLGSAPRTTAISRWNGSARVTVLPTFPYRFARGVHRQHTRTLALHPTLNGAVALVVPHSIRSVPPAEVSSMEIVTCSTGFAALPCVIGALPSSSAG